MSRTVTAEGRSRANVGGRGVPVGVLQELADDLVAVHGQSEQLRLKSPAAQREMLDRELRRATTAASTSVIELKTAAALIRLMK